MAVTVARVHLAMAHAAMPGLLPTPPGSKMLPLLPTPSCAAAEIMIPAPSPPKPSRADAVERWDINKKSPTSFSSSSCGKWERTKRPGSRGLSSSAERWDAHKKPRPSQAGEDDGQSSTGSNGMEVDDEPQPQMGPYAGQGFFAVAPPEPTMLPVPSFLVLPRFIG
jgi:hypothetical protein